MVTNRATLSDAKRARLVEFLGALPNAAAVRLFSALEHDRGLGGDLPQDALLDELRLALLRRNAAFPARKPSAQRMFFKPFEDFFVLHRAGRKRRGRIVRTSIAPIWRLLQTEPRLGQAARLAAAVDSALRQTGAVAPSLARGFLEAAAEGFAALAGEALSDGAARTRLAAAIGGEDVLLDLLEIAALLPAAERLQSVQAAFPRPVAALAPEDIFRVRSIYTDALAADAEIAPYILIQLTGRLERPAKALAIYYHFLNARDGALADARHDAGVVADVLFEDLESAARLLERDVEAGADPEGAVERFAAFAAFARDLADEAARARDKVIAARIEACRDIAAEALARYAEHALSALRRAAPLREARGSAALVALRPDFAAGVAPPALEAARSAAEFLNDVSEAANALERRDAGAGLDREGAEFLRRYLQDLVVEIRAADGEDRAKARRLMERLLEIAAPLIGASERDLLSARAAAAAVTA